MYNDVMHLKFYKIFFIFKFLIIQNIFICVSCLSYTKIAFASTSFNESYDFVKFDLLYGQITQDKPSRMLLGLNVNLSPGWKIYWKNPGEAGLPPILDTKKTKNINSAELLFPNPKRFVFFGIETFGYDDQVIFPIIIDKIQQEKDVSGFLELNAQVCSEICVPVRYNFDLSLLQKSSTNLDKILKFYKKVPIALNKKDLKLHSVKIRGNEFTFTLDNNLSIQPKDIIVEDNKGNIYEKPIVYINGKILSFRIDMKNFVVNDLNKFVKLTFITDKINYEKKITNLKEKIFYTSILGLEILIIAFVGGFILNFMPCVLPVLSLKMLQLVNFKTNEGIMYRNKILCNIAGILITFLILAVGTYLIKFTGNIVGWGMQFQNIYFLIFMIMLTLFFALNLLDIFQYFIPSKILSLLSYKTEGYFGDILTGIFLTFLATPCTAPLVGTAIGFALSGDMVEIFSILLIMGLGFSAPLILLMIFPSLITFIPKPGKWMVTFKKIMAFLLLLTSFWLISVLIELQNTNNQTSKVYEDNLSVINWDMNDNDNLIKELLEKNKNVFLDVTADWCLTCQANKIFVINSKEIIELFKKNNITIVSLDWTKPNDKIKQFLNSKGRYGIPFNEFYSNSIPNGKVLPELLSKKIIKDYLKLIE